MSRMMVVVVLALLLVGGAVAADTAFQSAGEERTFTNESFTPSTDFVELNGSNVSGAFYDESVTVRDENETSMVNGTDYVWNETNGTVRAVSGGRLENDSVGYIDYSYREPTPEQTAWLELFGLVYEGAAPLVLIVGIALFFAVMRSFGG